MHASAQSGVVTRERRDGVERKLAEVCFFFVQPVHNLCL